MSTLCLINFIYISQTWKWPPTCKVMLQTMDLDHYKIKTEVFKNYYQVKLHQRNLAFKEYVNTIIGIFTHNTFYQVLTGHL